MDLANHPSGDSSSASRRRKAFTLLELLIVVAAVSILSGIAVPVFLEAKTRANVARAKADMRMVALGMESYFSDHAEYPKPDNHDGKPIGEGIFDADPYDTRVPLSLTRPVRYIDSRFEDPFRPSGADLARTYLLYTKEYFRNAVGEAEYKAYLGEIVGPSSVLQVEYIVVSRGPDLDHDEPQGHTWPTGDNQGDPNGATLYDPTNGTISNGDVIYMGAGIGYKDR